MGKSLAVGKTSARGDLFSDDHFMPLLPTDVEIERASE